jgi:xylose isomerase
MYFDEVNRDEIPYRYYQADKKILGKTMRDHLRPAVCWWHTLCWQGDDAFGGPSFERAWLKASDPMARAKAKLDAGFELIDKLGMPFFTFHDRDLSPEGATIKESHHNLDVMCELTARKMQDTGIDLLWGTANLFSHRRYMAGAATNPNPDVFACAVSQVKKAIDVTQTLGGENYVLWGGREGYDTLLNTHLKQEGDQLARFMSMLVDYKHKIGFKGLLLIEPKPCEPTKHQYDYDTGHVFAFLQKYGLEKEYKVNIEANHATLAGHSFEHEVAYACAHDLFGSIDANTGDPQLGWDTDQFPMDVKSLTLVIYEILHHGGFTSGGFNFDAKLRRQSIDPVDLCYGFVNGLDTLAHALENAAKMIENDQLQAFKDKRYAGWNTPEGQAVLRGDCDFETLANKALDENLDPKPVSGRQEMLEGLIIG